MARQNPFAPVIEAIDAHMATWDASSATEVVEMLDGIGDVGDSLRKAVHRMHEHLEDRPRLRGVVDALRFMAGMVAPIQELAQDVAAGFKEENTFWLKSE